MKTTLPVPTLIIDYTQWLNFLMTSRETIRHYDHQLTQLGKRYPEMSEFSNYLRSCMHQRRQFFGELAIQLTGRLAQLRKDPTDKKLVRRMSRAHPTMLAFITQLMDAFAEIEESYQTLLPFQQPAQSESTPMLRYRQHPTA